MKPDSQTTGVSRYMTPTPEMIAAQFGAAAPIGTPCLYYPSRPFQRDQAIATKVRSDPWVLGHGQVVVKVDGIAGGVAIEHIAFDVGATHDR